MRATRCGSSPNVSSVRPQRGSRHTSSTGERPWWAPIARIWTRTESATASARSGSHVDARPIACGNTTAPRAIRPEQLSSCSIGGPQAAGAADARDLAQPVGQQGGGAFLAQVGSVGELEDPGAAELGCLLAGRHAVEQVIQPLLDGPRRVPVQGAGAVESGGA